MSSVRVDMLNIRESDNVVVAATHGRGLYYAEYPVDYCTTDIAAMDNESGISVYPNPTKGVTTVDFKGVKDGDYTIYVFDNNGRVVLTKRVFVNDNGSCKLDLGNLVKGNYFIRTNINNKIHNHKVVVI